MHSARAVVFDSDGTLFNTRAYIHAAYAYIAKVHGLPQPTTDQIDRQLGKTIRDILRALFPGEDVEALYRTNDEYAQNSAVHVAAFAGVKDLLRTLRAQDVKLAILTSGGEKVHLLLEHHNLDNYFSSVVYTERISRPKPDPEGLFLAMKECEVMPSDTIMVGDTVVDIEVGKRAQVNMTVGVTYGFGDRKSLEVAGADYVIDSIAELPALVQYADK